MPNILLTDACNLHCDFCFAKDKLKVSKTIMSMENVRHVLDFLRASGYPYFRVMGGEPTLHPKFREIIELALGKGFQVDVLSNATWEDELNDFFLDISPAHLRFLLNIVPPGKSSEGLYAEITRNLSRIAARFKPTLSFNIDSPDADYAHILALVARYAIPVIRVSHALPIFSMHNAFLKLEDYRHAAKIIMRMLDDLRRIGSSLVLDNAILPCAFTKEEIGILVSSGSLNLSNNLRCRPIIDIGPELDLWACFCLTQYHENSLRNFKSLDELIAFYEADFAAIRGAAPTFEECERCLYREKWDCQGGCLAFRLQNEAVRQGLETQETVSTLNRSGGVPRVELAAGVSLFEFRIPYHGFNLLNRNRNESYEIPSALAVLLSGEKPNLIGEAAEKMDGDMLAFMEDEVDLSINDALKLLSAKGLVRYG